MMNLDEALSNLANVHRRRVLLALLDLNPQTVAGLSISEVVHAGDTKSGGTEMQMSHVHLPKLDDAGFIKWDREGQQVVKGPGFEEIKPLLELLAGNADELPDNELQ